MRITLISLFYLCVSCSGAKLSENTSQRSAVTHVTASATDDETIQTNATEESEDKSNFASGEITTSSTPIAVGGAYLYCSKTTAGVECVIHDEYQRPVDFVGLNAYIVSGSPAVWSKVALTPTSKGHWTVTLPPGLSGSFAVVIDNQKGEIVADWVVDSVKPPVTLITDGGFESFVVDSFGYSYFTTSNVNSWSIKLPATGATCDEAKLEVQLSRSVSSDVKFLSREGRNFVELNSACGSDPSTEGPNNTIVYQTFDTVPGHVYQLSFAAGRTQSTEGSSILGVKVGGKSVLQREFTSEPWIDFKILFMATAVKTTLEFQELAPGDTPFGTVLDAVAVYDIGSGCGDCGTDRSYDRRDSGSRRY